VIDQLGISRLRQLLIAGLGALILCTAFMLASASPASALYQRFCWGKNLPGGNIGSVENMCDSYYNDGKIGYIDEVGGSGAQHSVCAYAWYRDGISMCSSGPNQGVYNRTPVGRFTSVGQLENNARSANTVYGYMITCSSPCDGSGGGGGGNPPPPPPPGWYTDNLGGSIASDPDMSTRGYGTLSVFARGTNNHLMHKGYGNGNWASWEDLGGSLTSGPGAVSWNSDRIDVVARTTNNSVAHWAWSTRGWVIDNLGGNITSDPDISSWGYGRLDVFARGTNNHLMHRAFANGNWQSWEDLGGTLASGPGAVSWSANRIDVVARATDNTVLHWAWNGSAWVQDNLGGDIASDPDISSKGYGGLDIFARSPAGDLVHLGYNGAWNWEWLGWLSGDTLASGPGAVSWNSSRIDVAGRTGSGTVAHWAWG
jgi:hypothetical protein